MRTNTKANPQRKPENTGRQWKARLGFILVIVGLLVATWLIRYPKGYANAFLGHYVGTTAMLEQTAGVVHTEEEQSLAAPLQTDYDNWKQTHLHEKLEITSATDETLLVGDFYDAVSNVTVIALHSFDGSRADD